MATTQAPTETEPRGASDENLMTVDRFLKLVEAGVFTVQDRVFLWHGRLVEEMTKGRPHTISQFSLQDALRGLLPREYHVEIEAPLVLGNSSLPEPDLAVIRGSSYRDFPDRPPSAADAALIIEVSDSTVAFDSGEKLQAYAAERIPVYWIVNLPKRRIEVYSQPTGPVEKPSYQEQRHYGLDEEVPILIDGREVGRIAAREILP